MKQGKLEVRSASNAELFRSDCPWAAISVSSTNIFPGLHERNRVGLLQLVFADTADAQRSDSFNTALAAQILDFVRDVWDQVETILVHCEAGLSRSPAIAAAISRIYYDDDGPWFEFDFPNRLVFKLLIHVHSKKLKEEKDR